MNDEGSVMSSSIQTALQIRRNATNHGTQKEHAVGGGFVAGDVVVVDPDVVATTDIGWDSN